MLHLGLFMRSASATVVRGRRDGWRISEVWRFSENVVNGRRRGHNVGQYSLFADRMYRQGAPGIYLFNPFDNKPEVWKSLVSEGLPPSLVAMRAKGVTATDEHD